jgi:hypothetical protein
MPSVSQAALKKPPASAQTTLDLWTPRPGSPVSTKRIGQLMESAAEIEARDPWSAKMVKYAGRCFIQANLPHSSRNIDPFSTFTRTNGKMTLQIKPDTKYGIPYGTIPRLLLMWIANEVRTKKNSVIALGDTLSPFMRQLDIVPTGGQWGTVTRLKDQMLRLFNADIRFRYEDSSDKDAENAKGKLYSIEDYDLWWGRKTDVTQSAFWQSTIVLTGPLFRELLMHSVPIDMRVIKALRRSPMELDVYCWLTYRMLSLDYSLFLSYSELAQQFGSSYSNEKHFRVNINKALWAVMKQYTQVRVEIDATHRDESGWRLQPSPTHVPPKHPRKPKNIK